MKIFSLIILIALSQFSSSALAESHEDQIFQYLRFAMWNGIDNETKLLIRNYCVRFEIGNLEECRKTQVSGLVKISKIEAKFGKEETEVFYIKCAGLLNEGRQSDPSYANMKEFSDCVKGHSEIDDVFPMEQIPPNKQ